MKLFLDCEFNGFQGALISMALVSEDGREWYEVVPCAEPVPWVDEHVMPVLGKPPLEDCAALSHSLGHFLAQFQAVQIIADWPEDISLFCQALITGPGSRISTPRLSFAIIPIESSSDVPHNALEDARGIRRAVQPHAPISRSSTTR